MKTKSNSRLFAVLAAFDSHTWSAETVKEMEELLQDGSRTTRETIEFICNGCTIFPSDEARNALNALSQKL